MSAPASGPWSVCRISRWHDGTPQEFDYLEVKSSEGFRVAFAWDCKPKSFATMNLISAAPDLLQVVEDYVLLCDLHGHVGAVPSAAREALRKAKGEA